MQLLITGAFGTIGRETVKKCLLHGHNVVAFDLPTKSNKKYAKKIQKFCKKNQIALKKMQLHWGNLLSCKEIEYFYSET